MALLYILAKVAEIMMITVIGSMFLRSILSLFTEPEDSRLYQFLAVLTEPVILPMRLLFDRLNVGQDLPIDLAFFATYLLLAFLVGFMPAI